MGEGERGALRIVFDRRLKLEFLGSKETSDAGGEARSGVSVQCMMFWPWLRWSLRCSPRVIGRRALIPRQRLRRMRSAYVSRSRVYGARSLHHPDAKSFLGGFFSPLSATC